MAGLRPGSRDDRLRPLPDPSGSKGSGLPGWGKALLAVVVLFGAGELGLHQLKRGRAAPAPASAKSGPAHPAPVKPAAPAGPPDDWFQEYDTTFLYGGQRVELQRLEVVHANSATAAVQVRLQVLPRRHSSGWLSSRSTYQLAAPGRQAFPARVAVSAFGLKRNVKVTFRWPTGQLVAGSKFNLRIPTSYGSQRVSLLVQMPKSHVGIADGLGGPSSQS